MIFMRVHKYWLEYDAAALAFLIVGMAAVGLLAVVIWLRCKERRSANPATGCRVPPLRRVRRHGDGIL